MPSSFAKQNLAGNRKWNRGRESTKEHPFEDQTQSATGKKIQQARRQKNTAGEA